jgi:hypothetical protein
MPMGERLSDSEFQALLQFRSHPSHRTESIEALGLEPPIGDNALVAVPLVRHWLFAPDKTKARIRAFTIDVKHKGERLVQSFRIGDPTAPPGKGYGILTVRHQRALFALQELWQQQRGRMVLWEGRRQGMVNATSWEIEDRLFGTHGGRQKAMVRQVIQELASIPVAIKNYISPEGEVTDIETTGLISGALFSQSRRKTNPSQMGFPWVEIMLGDIITRAFEISAIKPLNLRVIRSMRDTAALLYPKLDYMLQGSPSVSFRLPTLVRNLGLSGEIQRQPARRRRLFTSTADELSGQPLSKSGTTLRVHVAQGAAADGEDLLIAESH